MTPRQSTAHELASNIASEGWTVAEVEKQITMLLAAREREVWLEAINKVAQDWCDNYGAHITSVNGVEVQAFLDTRHVHYPECQQAKEIKP